MKIVIAPDSFKGAVRAGQVADILAGAWREIRPADEVLTIPMSDGGEGLAEALASARGGVFKEFDVWDPLRRPVRARAVLIDKLAVIESAEANGIELLSGTELNPLIATTYGVGMIFRQLLDRGCREFIVGIGGSATVDGGAGMLQALGMKIFDRHGNLLPDGIGGGDLANAAKTDVSSLDPRLSGCRIMVACDVTNPLCGKSGSATVFGPQKGADADMVIRLDANLRHWAELHCDEGNEPGDGAAGGLGFALRKFLGGKLLSGAGLVMEYSGFADALDGADLVITGEGCSDEQTAYGKLCARVAEAAKRKGVPTVLVSGALRGDCTALEELFCGIFSISPGAVSLDEAIKNTGKNLSRTGRSLAKIFSL